MSSSDAGSPTSYPATIQIPDDTDPWDASSYAPGLAELADRTRWLGQFTAQGGVFPSVQTWGANFTGEGGSAVTVASADDLLVARAGVIGSGGAGGFVPSPGVAGIGGVGGPGVLGIGAPTGSLGGSFAGTGNNDGLHTEGSGSGFGMVATGGSTAGACGVEGVGGAGGGPGANFTATGASYQGAYCTGSGSGSGATCQGGATGVGLIALAGGTGDNDGIQSAGSGAGAGAHLTGGGSGNGATCQGGGSGFGVKATGGATAGACGVEGIGGAAGGPGGNFTATGATYQGAYCTGSGSGSGATCQGGATGTGVIGLGGATSGAGVSGTGGPNSSGVVGNGTGTGNGVDASADTTSFNPSLNRPLAVNASRGPVHVESAFGDALADPGPNNLWAEAIPKAWIKITTDGSGGSAVADAFNCGAGIVTMGKAFTITFGRPFANTNYVGLGTFTATGSGSPSIYGMFPPSTTTGDCVVGTVGDDPHTTAGELMVIFFGRQ